MSKGPKLTYTFARFEKEANKLHRKKYRYLWSGDKNQPIRKMTKVKIICPEHGRFEQYISDHLRGYKCPGCGYRNSKERTTGARRMTTKEFIAKARVIHGDTYSYARCQYISSRDAVTITCKKHGDVEVKPAAHHINPKVHRGCTHCGRERSKALLMTNRSSQDRFKLKEYVMPNGETVMLQGYEHYAVEHLLNESPKRKLYFGRDINSIAYEFGGRKRTYLPDIRYKDTLVEVKSTWTWADAREKNVAKLRAVMNAGFNVRLLVFHPSGRILVDRETTPDGTVTREYFAKSGLRRH